MDCQKFAGKQKLFSLPLNPVVIDATLQQWGLYFIDEINPPSSGENKYILIAIYFFTK